MALLDSRNLTSKELVPKNGLLKTNGALTKMNVPDGWSAKMITSANPPGLPPETVILLKKEDGLKVSIGLYFSGMTYEVEDGLIRKSKLFDEQISIKAGTPEACKLIGGEGAHANKTQTQLYLLRAGRHGVESDEKYCRAIQTTDFHGLQSVIYEFENDSRKTKTVEYCIDVLGNGRVVYSLYYSAPIDAFAQNMDTAINAFQSSEWRKDFDSAIPLDVID